MTDTSDTGHPRDTSAGAPPAESTGPLPETAGSSAKHEPSAKRGPSPSTQQAREDYGFACLHCGHTWEQGYDIERHLDRDNNPYFLYFTNGERVPSPLATVTCLNCQEHKVRITGSQRVSAVHSAWAPGWPFSR